MGNDYRDKRRREHNWNWMLWVLAPTAVVAIVGAIVLTLPALGGPGGA